MKKPIYKRKWFVVLVILLLIGSSRQSKNEDTNVDAVEYKVITSEDVGIGLKDHTFRISASKDITDEQILWLVSDLDKNKYNELTIWIYDSKESYEGFSKYNIAMVERFENGEIKISK